MKEIISLIFKVLFIPIPMPISFNEKVQNYNLMGILIVLFIFFIISLIIRKTTGGAGD